MSRSQSIRNDWSSTAGGVIDDGGEVGVLQPRGAMMYGSLPDRDGQGVGLGNIDGGVGTQMQTLSMLYLNFN